MPPKGPRMAKSVDDRGRGARTARRDEGAYCRYVTEEQRSQPGEPGCIGRERDRLSHSRALRCPGATQPEIEAASLGWNAFVVRRWQQ